MFFVGILGEYIGAIHTLVQNRPYVFERERINFEFEPGLPLVTPEAGEQPAPTAATR